MSSFWNLFGDKKESDASEEEGAGGEADAAGTAAPKTNASVAPNNPQRSAPPPGLQQEEKVQVVKTSEAPPKVVAPAQKSTTPRYGIDDAIKLMRTLPVDDNVDLVVRVIKRTLESLAVKVPDIIDDAGKRQDGLRQKIGEHKGAIAQLEREIDARRFEISRLEDDLAETTTVRERLQLAEATALQPTPAPSKVSTAPSSSLGTTTYAAAKKPDLTQSQSTKAPPLPPSRKPSPTTVTTPTEASPVTPVVKKQQSDEIPVVGGDDDDEQPVESRDLVDK